MTIQEKIGLLHALGALLKPEVDSATKAIVCNKIVSVLKSITTIE